MADQLVDPRLQRCELGPELGRHRRQRLAVDHHPGQLHVRQHRHEWHLDLGEERQQARLGELRLERRLDQQ